MMTIEQMGESLHANYNGYEKKRKNEKNRCKRFFLCIKAHENQMRNSRDKFEKTLKEYPNGKSK